MFYKKKKLQKHARTPKVIWCSGTQILTLYISHTYETETQMDNNSQTNQMNTPLYLTQRFK